MTIIVVKTCDGPVYFANARDRQRADACRMALEQMREHNETNADRQPIYEQEEIAIAEAAEKKGLKPLMAALIDIGAIRVEGVRD